MDIFKCEEEAEEPHFCIFHGNDRCLRDKTDHEKHQGKVLDRLKQKVNHAISDNEPLVCIGFHLPDFSLSDLSINKTFTKPVYFSHSQFLGYVDFSEANFQVGANFSEANFEGEAYFSTAKFSTEVNFSGHFNDKTKFNYVLFEGKEKVIFDVENLSNISFMNTDLTGVRFNDEAIWGGGEDTKEDRFKTLDERLLEEEIKDKDGHTTKDFNLGSIKAVYRNLRENYEYRMRYDEAGQFFIREMELKRKYREVVSKQEVGILEIKQNNWFIRNLLSLTGWYYHLSRYEESIWRSTLAGLVIVFLSTLFWTMQENPEVKPSLPIFQSNEIIISNSTNNVT